MPIDLTVAAKGSRLLTGYRSAYGITADAADLPPNTYPHAVPLGDVRAMLDFQVVSAVVRAEYDNGHLHSVVVPNKQALVRTDIDLPLGIHSESYAIHQYPEWLVQNVENILDDGLTVSRAGILRGGAIAFVQVEFPESAQAGDGVSYRPFLTATTSHNGMVATTYMAGSMVVSCENTIHLAQREAEGTGSILRIRHTANSALRLGEARDALGVMYETVESVGAEIDRMVAQVVTDDQWDAFVDAYVGKPQPGSQRSETIRENKVRALNGLYRGDDPRVAPWKGSLYGAYMAANTYRLHEAPIRGKGRGERNALDAVTGRGAEADARALRILTAVAS